MYIENKLKTEYIQKYAHKNTRLFKKKNTLSKKSYTYLIFVRKIIFRVTLGAVYTRSCLVVSR